MWKTGSLASREKWVTIKSCLCINWHIYVCISLHDLKICLSLSLLLQSREMRSPVRDTPLKCEIGGDPGPAGPTTGETCYCGRGIGVARFTWHWNLLCLLVNVVDLEERKLPWNWKVNYLLWSTWSLVVSVRAEIFHRQFLSLQVDSNIHAYGRKKIE